MTTDTESRVDSSSQDDFNRLGTEEKLGRLNTLIQRSSVYSKIIAENILQDGLGKKAQDAKQREPSRKKRKKDGNPQQKDIISMLSAPSADTVKQKQPKLLSGVKLKDYQLDGMEWLITLYENGLNGILADEMGLGKTVQCIAFLAFLIENGISGPFLVVAPLSTLTNWEKELHRFAPSVTTLKYIGSKDQRSKLKLESSTNIILTSYEMSIKDFPKLNHINWKYLIIDEGHRLKNNNCTLIKTLKKLNVSNKLLITGTPLQNNLKELWSLLNFILPDIFHDLDLFQQWFNFDQLTDFENENDMNNETNQFVHLNIQENLVKNLHTILKPFILRRLKREVIQDLPPKKEYIIHISLSPLQRKLYRDALDNKLFKGLLETYFKEYIKANTKHYNITSIDNFLSKKFTDEQITDRKKPANFKEEDSDDEFVARNSSDDESSAKGLSKQSDNSTEELYEQLYVKCYKELRHTSLQNLIIQLRNICNSPYIFYDPVDYETGDEAKFQELLVENSSKFNILAQILDKLLCKHHKVLIFSQFIKVLDLINDFLNYRGIEVCRLDGSITQDERDDEIKEFNTKDTKKQVFLISTRAGGLGINLTAADTVIIFDNDWNPQIDLQAIDRVHRIGQDKPIKIFRFLVNNSVEEILLTKSHSKRFLEKVVIQMGEFKFKNVKNIISDRNLNLDNIVALSKKFRINGDNMDDLNRIVAVDNNEDRDTNKLTDQELNEILDRSSQCYSKTDKDMDFKHVTVFETLNNMDI
ncbi:Piso0_002042 [Millerozyma farinosa CBS 7064]|uniref:Piso0_002042 protein n=1 Tax=Pichia sorbitophila (strain ATCC MYA-4447 / BCRC 22081 / CBS 7064 / NBRC 10061 / NRRL Y-12695) TaxID=559304 RepID=G8YBJ1_PICSO|nr:Piso0_002042 [Millerozyma farinosa CBS 7064]